MTNPLIKIFAAGDVMTGRGIDQILRHPSNPQIYESYVKDARDYVRLAEVFYEPIPRKVKGDYIWGDALVEWNKRNSDAKIVNLETAITTSEDYWPGKGINYRMHPDNIEILKSAGIDLCALANNHTLDWGIEGMGETLAILKKSSIQFSGAGLNLKHAMAPAIKSLPHNKRLLFFSIGHQSSGIPSDWSASLANPGLYILNRLDHETLNQIKSTIDAYKTENDLIVVSIHWGGNWGHDIPTDCMNFAHALIDKCGVDMIHGHSSHHPLGIEVYRQKPIIYGCGDFINDYEGITGSYRGDLRLMYFLDFDPHDMKLISMDLVPLQMRKFQLHYAGVEDCRWISHQMNEISKHFGSSFKLNDDGTIHFKLKHPTNQNELRQFS